MRRVVITGLGLVTPLASGVEESWTRILNGQSGASSITRFDPCRVVTKYACEVPLGDGTNGTFRAEDWIDAKDRRKLDDFILYGIAAAEQATRDAEWRPEDEDSRLRTGVMIGSGIGGLNSIANTAVLLHEKGPRRISPFFIPGALINLISGQVSNRFGVKGPNHSVVTACASGAHAIGDSFRIISQGDADVMISGGTESACTRFGIAGFCAMRALSTSFNNNPEKASRPWDKNRDGFVLSEGSGMIVLEELEHAKKRSANIYAEIVGYGLSGDAYHPTAPASDGDGGFRAMKMALKNAHLDSEKIDYINAHGTSTPLGDEIEFNSVKKLFVENTNNLLMSSTKSSTGHLLGASGAVEAIFSILSIKDGIAPPTLNLEELSDACVGINLVPKESIDKEINHVLSNSFGFGGTNVSLIFKKI